MKCHFWYSFSSFEASFERHLSINTLASTSLPKYIFKYISNVYMYDYIRQLCEQNKIYYASKFNAELRCYHMGVHICKIILDMLQDFDLILWELFPKTQNDIGVLHQSVMLDLVDTHCSVTLDVKLIHVGAPQFGMQVSIDCTQPSITLCCAGSQTNSQQLQCGTWSRVETHLSARVDQGKHTSECDAWPSVISAIRLVNFAL